MRSIMWLGALAVTAILAAACASPNPAPRAATTATTSPSPCPSTQNRNLEIVLFKGSSKVLVRDITDILQPRTLAMLDGSAPQFATATDVSFVRGPTLMRMSLCGSPSVVAEPVHGLYHDSYAWSPDGKKVAYVTNVDSQSQLRLVDGGQDRVIGSMPQLAPTHGCTYQSCVDQSDIRLLYSPDGAFISFVQNLGGPSLRIWSSDGKLLASGDAESAQMSVWSDNSLYFRDDKGVEVWRGGVQSLLMSGVAWIRPKSSPMGSQIVYVTRDAVGSAHVQLLDTTTGKTREIAKSRSEPSFLNSHLIWYRDERPCTPNDACSGAPTIWSGKTYIYDLEDNTETESIIAQVFDVWPHPA